MERLRASGAVIHRLEARGNHDPRLAAQLWRIAGRTRPDLMQVWLMQMDVLGAVVGTVKRIPWILSERSCEMAYGPSIKTWLRARVASTASAIVSNSTAGDRYWATRLRRSVPSYVIPNAVPLEEVAGVPQADPMTIGLDADARMVLFVGRFSEEKNVGILLKALRSVLITPGVVAVLAGDGPLVEIVRRLNAEYGLADRVRLPGYVENVWGFMKRASLFVSPAAFEGHPNAVIEAMACGCPIVASDIPAHRAFLGEDAAVLVPPDDPARLAKAILDVLANPAAAKERARRAEATVRQWSVERVAREYDRVYCEILGRTGKSTRGAA